MTRKTLLCLLLLLLPVLIVFGPILLGNHSFAYRDSARFYYRQFEWNQTQWSQGRVPLWNSQENLGEPVVAEATSSVFYPLQLVFHLPGLSYSTAFVFYAALHVYLASIGAFFLARTIGCGYVAAMLGAVCYANSGSLLFQTCNIVFLVGGCWLPFCLWMSIRLLQRPQTGPAIGLGCFMALAILGGDPQTAYHMGILSAIFVGCQVWWTRKSNRKAEPGKVRRSLVFHLVAALIALGLAAVQILPSWHATRQSTRGYAENARSIWELVDPQHENSWQGILGHPQPATHQDHLYQFSQTPWSLFELVWPNVSGEIESTNSRWTEVLPATSRTWTTSLYCGLGMFALFLSAVFRKSRRATELGMKWCALIFVLGSFGWYGLGWLGHELGSAGLGLDPAKSSVGAPVGGVYWFLVVLLPGYVNFRYPAKLFLVATLLICLLGAREFQTLARKNQFARFRKYLLGLFWATAAVLVGLWLAAIPLNRWFELLSQRTASEFGPFDSSAAWSAIIGALLQAMIFSVMGIVWINQQFRRRWLKLGLVLLCIVDLLLANHRLLITTRSSLWDRPQLVRDHLNDFARPVRIYRTDPMTWSTKSSWMQKSAANRLEQIVDYEVQTMMARHHLATESPAVGLTESFRTLEDLRFATLMAYLNSGPGLRTNDSYDVLLAPNPVALGNLGIDYLLIPKWGKPALPDPNQKMNDSKVVELAQHEALLIENPYRQKRFKIVHEVETVSPIPDLNQWLQQEEIDGW